jgi:class 3 adenylate cyclase/tetratricopeptide (TPR) repeat protein
MAGAAARTLPRAYTPRHLADRILASKSALEGERKPVTVLFADVARSMELAERVDAEDWHTLLDRFFKILTEGIHLFEGTINQFTGDGIMALFGAPIAHEDHAERACRAALDLSGGLRAFSEDVRREWGLDFAVRIGLNSGEVVVGRIGDDLRMDYTAQGHVVGLAARVQTLAPPGCVWVTEHTARLAAGFFEFVDRGEHRLKGVSAAVRLFELRGPGSIRSRFERARAFGFAEFVGREAEIARLEGARERAASGHPQVILVSGEAGVGKSRLCHEFVVRSAGVTLFHVRALSHGRLLALHAIVDLARQLFGATEAMSAAAVREAVEEGLSLAPPVDRIAFGAWLELLGAPDPTLAPSEIEPDVLRARLLSSLAGTLRARARSEPMVIWIEDLYWLDSASDRALEFLADDLSAARSAGCRILMLVTTRPEHQPSWSARLEKLALQPLSVAAGTRLLDDWLGRDAALAPLRDRIESRARGNPLFVEEIVHSLLEAGALSGERGAYASAAPELEPTLPETVQAVIASRIDRLDPRDKDVLHAAAVVGHDVSPELLRIALGVPESELDASLARLSAAELLATPDTAGLRTFRHPLTQEVAYRTQLVERRRGTHSAVARGLLALHGAAIDAHASILAHHFEEAGEHFEAARWHERAGRLARNDPADGRQHLRKVWPLLAHVPTSPATLRLELTSSIALLELGRIDGIEEMEAEELFQRARGVAELLDEPAGHAFLLFSYGRLRGIGGDVAQYLACAERAAALVSGLDDASVRFEMGAALAHAQLAAGRLAFSRATAAEALGELIGNEELARRLARATAPALCHIWWCLASAYLGFDDEAEAGLEALLADENERGFEALYGTRGFLCEVLRLRGETARALEHGRGAVELANDRGSPFSRVEAAVFLGSAELAAGDVVAATRTLETALALARAKRTALWYETRLVATLADAKRMAGDRLAASVLLAEAHDAAKTGRGWRSSACDVELCRVRFLASDPNPDPIEIERALASLDGLAGAMGATAYQRMAQLERDRMASRAEP